MDVIRIERKNRYLNVLEKYYLYKIYRNNLHMKDVPMETHYLVFQTVHELSDRLQYIHYIERYLRDSNYTRDSTREDSTNTY